MDFKIAFEMFFDNWDSQIKISKDRNLHGFGSDAGFMGEALASYITGKMGLASGGSGYDLSDGNMGDECKLTNWVQPNICRDCKSRVIYYDDVCFKCGSDNLKPHSDSRWGISAKEAWLYKDTIENYVLQVLKPLGKYSVLYEAFIVKGNNENFLEYISNQHFNSDSNLCNLLPYSYDFYRFSPCKVASVKCNIGEKFDIVYYNPDNIVPEKLDKSVLTKKEIELHGVNVDPVNLPLRKKNLNKNRGNTKRKL